MSAPTPAEAIARLRELHEQTLPTWKYLDASGQIDDRPHWIDADRNPDEMIDCDVHVGGMWEREDAVYAVRAHNAFGALLDVAADAVEFLAIGDQLSKHAGDESSVIHLDHPQHKKLAAQRAKLAGSVARLAEAAR